MSRPCKVNPASSLSQDAGMKVVLVTSVGSGLRVCRERGGCVLGTGKARVGNTWGACWEHVSRVPRAQGLSREQLPPGIRFRTDYPTLQVSLQSSFEYLDLGLQTSFSTLKR